MDIYIVDTETTGLDGINYGDHILEIAICKLNTELNEVKKIYQSLVGHQNFNHNAWIFQNTDLTPEIVKAGPGPKYVIAEVQKLLKNKYVTSFNTNYDFDSFLKHKPWAIEYKKLMPCIMRSSTNICKIPSIYGHNYKWPRLEEAFDLLVETENVSYHRAMDDCYASALVLKELIKRKKYNLKN